MAIEAAIRAGYLTFSTTDRVVLALVLGALNVRFLEGSQRQLVALPGRTRPAELVAELGMLTFRSAIAPSRLDDLTDPQG